MQELDEREIYRWFEIMKGGNKLTEIRIIGENKVFSGYFTDAKTLIDSIKPYSKYNIFFTINQPSDEFYGREQRDKIIMRPKNSTTDQEIIGFDYVFLDLDSKRGSGINATDEELKQTKQKANEVYKFLIENGFNQPIITMSGNGVHLYLPTAIKNTTENCAMIKRFTMAMSMLFSDDNVEIDEKIFNPARIAKVPGTYSRKGSPKDTNRPQRKCVFVKVPDEIKLNDKAYFEKIANLYPEEEKPTRENNFQTDKFDLDSFLSKHGIGVSKIENVSGGKKFVLNHCVFNPNHNGKDAVIFQKDSGGIAYVCLHNSCSHYTWKDVRLKYEPDAYDRKDYAEFRQRQQYYNPIPKPVFVPKEETAEKGKKWLNMSDIKYVDINSMVAIPTGFEALDKKVMGLLLGDVTVLSGLSGCVDCDTEYFNGYKWVKISEYQEGDKVLQYNKDGTAELVYPKEYIKKPCNKMYSIKTKYGLNQCVSNEHRMVYETSKGNLAIKPFYEMKRMHDLSKNGFSGRFYTTYKYGGNGISLSEFEIRLMCAVICDGTFTNKYADRYICRFNLKKERKKKRLEWILSKLNINYRKEQYNPNDLEYNNYLVKSPRIEKTFSQFWYNCTNEQLQIICDEILYWDGSISDKRKRFSTTDKDTADFVQFAFSSCGYRASIKEKNRVGEEYYTNNKLYIRKSVEYEINITNRIMVSMFTNKKAITEYIPKDGFKYCFSVPSSMLVLRRDNTINITGNTGKTSWIDCLALNAINRGYKVAVWSGELQDFRFQGWINQIAAGKNYVQKIDGYDNIYYSPKHISEKINEWTKGKLFLYNNEYGSKWEQLFSDIKEIVEKEGVQLLVLDNLMSLQINGYDGDKYSKQTSFINDLKEYAKKMNVHIILVCHPRKEMGFLRKESISGTADLTNLADNVVIIHRVGKDFETRAGEFFGSDKVVEYMKYSSVIEVCKNRSLGVIDFLCGMYYEPESRRLKNEISEHIVYGWQIDPVQQSFIPENNYYEPRHEQNDDDIFRERIEEVPF